MQEDEGEGSPLKVSVVNHIMLEISAGVVQLHDECIVHKHLKSIEYANELGSNG
uniref:Uncharacterized protein n=1 Tax=Physcomitrium patens TaxID=3218 RepID=A0A2K1JJX1_PHYPA|nr:hypothetical protein PHYPA_018959 [Physcomitrium patens]